MHYRILASEWPVHCFHIQANMQCVLELWCYIVVRHAFIFIEFVHFPGSAAFYLAMIDTIKCGMSLAVENSSVSGKIVN